MIKRFLLAILTLSLSYTICEAQIFGTGSGKSKKFESSLFGKRKNNIKTEKVKEPKKVVRAKKKQEKNDAKLKKDYAKYIKASQKRAIEIQTPEVQERMKQNRKETILKNKEKRKAVRAATKKAGKKYSKN